MDPRNGEVLSLANWPRVDPNEIADGRDESAIQNRAVMSAFEPGSTFKAFTVAGALQEGLITPEDAARPCHPQLQVADRTIERGARHAATLNLSVRRRSSPSLRTSGR